MQTWEKVLFAAIALAFIGDVALAALTWLDPEWMGVFLTFFFLSVFVLSIPGGIMDAERQERLDAAAAKILRGNDAE